MKNDKLNQYLGFLLVLVFFASVSGILLFIHQEHFILLLLLFSIAFGSYLTLYRILSPAAVKWIWILVILVRIISFFAPPQLSDDYYRFYWDARISDENLSVYSYTPTEIMDSYPNLMSTAIYEKLNSPDYYSVYPPLLQWHYKIAYKLSDGSVKSFIQGMRIQFFLAELMALFLLFRGVKEKRKWLLYAINPLVIVELMGNLHAEVFVAIGIILLLIKSKNDLGFIAGSVLAIGSKISPVILLPPLIKFNSAQFTKRILPTVITLAIIFYPLWSDWEKGSNFLNSIQLYYQTFEFNGSLYPMVRYVVWLYTGYNPIAIVGPALQMAALLLITYLYIRSTRATRTDLPKLMIHIWIVYLLFSTTVHPWYLIPAIAILPFHLNYGVLFWSFSIILSYSQYNQWISIPSSAFILIEYLILLFGLLLDWNKKSPMILTHRA